MSWKGILKEDNELDERVKTILGNVEDFKDSSYYKNKEQFIERAYDKYKEHEGGESGLKKLIETLEFQQNKQNENYYPNYEHFDILDMKYVIWELEDLLDEMKKYDKNEYKNEKKYLESLFGDEK